MNKLQKLIEPNIDILNEPSVLTQEFINALCKKTLFNQFETKAKGDRGIIKGFASTYDVDEGNDEIVPGAFTQDLDKFAKNPIMLFSHVLNFVLGSFEVFEEQTNGLYMEGSINLKTQLGKDTFTLVDDGDLKGMSIGYSIITRQLDEETEVQKLLKLRLWEVSIVAIPMNQHAWVTGTKIFTGADIKEEDKETKTVIPYKNYGYADEDENWQAGREVREAEVEDLKKICAWYDSKEPDVKGSYKLPHHRTSDKKGVWRGIAAAMGALLGARGGVNIPTGDKKGVYNHLAKHYNDLDKDVPEFKDIEEVEFKDVTWHEDEKFMLECESLDGSLQASINILKYFVKEDRIKSINSERLVEIQALLNTLEELNPQAEEPNPDGDSVKESNNEKELDDILLMLESLNDRLVKTRKFDLSETVKVEIRKALSEATGKDL